MGAQREEGSREMKEEGAEETERKQPWNLMIKHRQIHRRGRRSHMAVSFTDPQVSMDLLRAVLQPSFNHDIMALFHKYHKVRGHLENTWRTPGEHLEFFERAAQNVKENVGEDVPTDQLIRDACRNALENAKQMFPEAEAKRAGPDTAMKRVRPAEDESRERGSPPLKKRKGRPGGVGSDRPMGYSSGVKPKPEAIRREGPKWDPSRLTESSTFVLGSRANKALGMGGTRGRIYIKHADLFKYAADVKDKQWLAERHHMRATGGKMAYLLIEEDIQEVANSDDYRDCPDLRMEEMKPFSVPPWMVEKMQRAMEAQRDASL